MPSTPEYTINARLLFELSPDLLCFLGKDGYFIKVNKAFCRVLGYSEQDLLSKEFLEFVHPEDKQGTLEHVELLFRNETIFNFKNRYRHADGSYKWFSWNGIQLPDKTYYASARDITQHQLTRKKLEQAVAANQKILDNSLDVVCTMDSQGCFVSVNKAAQTIWGYCETELIGVNILDLVCIADKGNAITIRQEVLSGTSKTYFKTRIIHKNGKLVPTIWSATWNAIEQTIFAIARDATESEIEAEKLRLSVEQYQLVREATRDVIWDWDLVTDTLSWGKGFEKYFGSDFGSDEVKTEYWKSHFHPGDKQRVLINFQAAITDPAVNVWREEYRYLKGNGEIFFIADQGYIVRNADKKAVRVVGAMQDITGLKEKELRIVKQNEQLREIAQINSHELRRPVATILGLMDLLDKSAIMGPENLELLDHLETTTRQLDEVIRRINEKSTS